MIKPALILAILATAGLAWWWIEYARKLANARFEAQYDAPLSPPEGPLRVYHLGHSLVGRDMPAMIEQLAGAGHHHQSQLGWGTSLKEHWEPDAEIKGFDDENDHPRFRPAQEAIGSGEFDAVVLTEMVEIRSAIKYHQSGKYLPLWADLARASKPGTRVYLYETWHKLDDPEGWLKRLDEDLVRYWENRLLKQVRTDGSDLPVYLIPAGQVMARFARAVEDRGGIDGISGQEDLFARLPDGTLDTIHLNDLGNYIVALTHYAVLFHRSPVGLPFHLNTAGGTAAKAPSPEAAHLMPTIVWEVVTSLPKTGVSP